MAKIVVKHLPYNATEDDLRELIGDVGEIVSIDLPMDHITGHAKAIATIELANEAEAADAVHHLNHREVRGHRVVVAHAAGEGLAAGEPLIEEEAPPAEPEPTEPLPHRPEREQGRSPGRFGG
jgi:RNA recognition motif-containing protein